MPYLLVAMYHVRNRLRLFHKLGEIRKSSFHLRHWLITNKP